MIDQHTTLLWSTYKMMLIYYVESVSVCVPARCVMCILFMHMQSSMYERINRHDTKTLPLKHHSSVLYLLSYNIESYDDGHHI